ncbi:MAG: M3 family oligoendopeptidase [Oscillospiraceae bacterium]|nr:M3 family oligoendopeptidase [Oscillospiraceae bacterium]
MKFTEFPYVRPDLTAAMAKLDELAKAIREAQDAATAKDAFLAYEEIAKEVGSARAISSVRHTVNTKDAFYNEENAFWDENSPILNDKYLDIYRAMVSSPLRPELEEALGKLLFTKMEIDVKSADPSIIPLMQEENALCTEYENLYASAQIPFDGKILTVAQLGPYKQSADRTVRKAAFTAEGNFFDENREKFDELYDKLVKNRTAQAKALGYETFTPLGYIRMHRNGYGVPEVENYRKQIVEYMVPAICELKKVQQQRIGVEQMEYCDDNFLFLDGNPKPQGTSEEILAAGLKMYRELSPETAEFIDFMFESELFDVLAKEGKAPGGYCTYIANRKSPFIFSNFNGTAGDVDVLTHEAGHAFAAYQAAKLNVLPEYEDNTLEACEVHSMGMEFMTSDFHHLFFGDQTEKYQLFHAEAAIYFLAYGCMVDEFQHIVYENPDLTPEERNQAWLGLEKKYRPYMEMGGLPFYGRGGGWQYKMHIYTSPFYYIDYCLAQTVALQFWAEFLKDPKDAWKRYLDLVNMAGTGTFVDVVKAAGLMTPFEDGCIKDVAETAKNWCLTHQLKK